MSTFVGRELELKKLNEISQLGRSCLVVVNGRRRIGKSHLIREFAKNKSFLPLSGIAPGPPTTPQMQRDEFGYQLSELLALPKMTFNDWSDAFDFLLTHLPQKPTVLLFDEISWMANGDELFIAKLKNWWDSKAQYKQNLIFILCGSVSTWIEKNIINSTAFFGRINLTITLHELSLSESVTLLKNRNLKASTYEFIKILSLTGGIPWYLEQINTRISVEDNFKNLCFSENGLFVKEFKLIFHDLFDSKSPIYQNIITHLSSGLLSLTKLREKLNYQDSGTLSQYLKNLVIAGFVSEHITWNVKAKHFGKKHYFRLKDNYLRFYIKYIRPNLAKINAHFFQEISLTSLANWNIIMGFQVENLLLANRVLLIKEIGINFAEIIYDGPYLQSATKRIRGCQIDYLIQTSAQTLYVCEFKFNRRSLGSEVIDAMKEKIRRLVVPKGIAIIPVLFHLGEVSPAVYDSQFFYKIIDIEAFI